MYSSVCVCVSGGLSHSSRHVGRLTKVKMLYSMRHEKHRKTEYRKRHMKPRRRSNVHLLRWTPITWTGGTQARTQQLLWDVSYVKLLNTHCEKHGCQQEPNREDQTFTVQFDLKQDIITVSQFKQKQLCAVEVKSEAKAWCTKLLSSKSSPPKEKPNGRHVRPHVKMWKSSQNRLHLSRSWSPASSGPMGDRVRPRCQTRCYQWSWTPPCLPCLHTDKGGVRKQRTGSGDDRVGDEVGSIELKRYKESRRSRFNIWWQAKNKHRWKDRGRHPVRLTGCPSLSNVSHRITAGKDSALHPTHTTSPPLP